MVVVAVVCFVHPLVEVVGYVAAEVVAVNIQKNKCKGYKK